MRAVNLLPADARTTKSGLSSVGAQLPVRRTLQIGGGVALVLTLALVGLFVHERSVVHSEQSTLANDQARLAAMQAQVDAVKNDQQEASSRMSAVNAVVSSRMNWDRTMGELAKVLPADSVLTSLTATAPVTAAAMSATAATVPTDTTAAPPSGTSTLTISGNAPTYVRVAAVLDRLALLPWLSGVTLESTSKGTGGTTTYAINATVSEVH
jgi:Tfp pilus assembly protein PilN